MSRRGDPADPVHVVQDTGGSAGSPASVALGDAIANPTVPLVGAHGLLWDGTQWVRMRGDTNGQYVQGNIAHDGVDAGRPMKVGARAVSADIAAVATNDRVDNISDLLGRQVVLPGAIPQNTLRGQTAAMILVADTQVIGSQGAGILLYVTAIVVTNNHATVATDVNIKEGATTILTVRVAAGQCLPLMFPTPLRIAANTALNAANVTTGSSVIVFASGYKAAL